MAYDGVLCGIIARQLAAELASAKIEKIQQPEPDEIIMQVATASCGRKKLLISTNPQGARVHYTSLPYENPAQPPNFCMLLRKHIQGGRINSVYQIETERIICFEIETVNEMGFSVSKKLYAESMGKHSNLVLVNAETGAIIDSIKRISIDVNRYRQLLPGVKYVLPPSQDKLVFWTMTKEELEERLQREPDPARCVQGFGALLASEYDTADKIIALRDGLDGSCGPARVYFKGQAPREVHAVRLPLLEESCESREFENIHDALDFFFAQKADTNRVIQKRDGLASSVGSMINKHLSKKQKLLEEIKAADESDAYRIKGELINANLGSIRPGEKKITLISYYDGQPVEIALDEKLSPAKNAQAYFKKYNKAKNSRKEKETQLAECEKDIAYLESVQTLVRSSSTYEELELLRAELFENGYIRINKAARRNKPAKPKPRRFTTSTGLEFVVGRSNTENDYITFKLGGKTDLWLHTKDIPGSHVVLFTGGAEPDETSIREAAAAAAFFSKGRESQNVPVDYVPLRYVKKPGGAKPGMVIFTNNRTVWTDPVEPK